jgi:hypothetical protein
LFSLLFPPFALSLPLSFFEMDNGEFGQSEGKGIGNEEPMTAMSGAVSGSVGSGSITHSTHLSLTFFSVEGQRKHENRDGDPAEQAMSDNVITQDTG